jgi:hypothetical protein
MEKSAFSTSVTAGQIGLDADAVLAVSNPPVLVPESTIAPEEVVSGSVAPVEMESPLLDTPTVDPLLEVQEPSIPADLLASSALDVGEPPEHIFEEFAPVTTAAAAVVSTESEAQSTQEEEARRLAFEALFNSTEPFPVDDFSAVSAGTTIATLPNMAEKSKDHPFDVAPDTEIESLTSDSQQEFTSPEPDPLLMQEEAPVNTGLTIPDHDLLLGEVLPTGWSETENAQESAENIAATSSEPDLPSSDQSSDLISASVFEIASDSMQHVSIEAHSVAPEVLESADQAEILQTAFEPEPAQLQPVSEDEYSETQHSVSEVVRSEPEIAVAKPALLNIEPEPEIELSELASPELGQTQPEAHVAETLSPPELLPQSSEAERIHQAVDRVFDRFKRLLVAAIVRELARHD